jgi:hypothetical protein
MICRLVLLVFALVSLVQFQLRFFSRTFKDGKIIAKGVESVP